MEGARDKVVHLPDGIPWLLQEDQQEEIPIFQPEAVLRTEEVLQFLNLQTLSIQEDPQVEQQIHKPDPQQ